MKLRIDVETLLNKSEKAEEFHKSIVQKNYNVQILSNSISQDAVCAMEGAESLDDNDIDNIPFDSNKIPKKRL